MRDRHLREAIHQQQCDDRCEDIAEDDGRPGRAYGKRAAEKETGADGAAERDHAHLAFGQFARQPVLVGNGFSVAFGRKDRQRIGCHQARAFPRCRMKATVCSTR